MKYKGIIITGTSGAGKSTIAKELIKKKPLFMQVRALTTREFRKDDDTHYIYIDEQNFDIFYKNDFLITKTNYRGKKYGVSIFALEEVEQTQHIPVFIVSPESLIDFKNKEEYLSFFIDASDEQLDERLTQREGKIVIKEAYQQRKEDRLQSDLPNYIVINNNVTNTVELVYQLWSCVGIGGLLPEKVIKLMISCGMLISNADISKVKSASYDLTLGNEYYYAGEIRRLEKNNLCLKIEPYDYAIVSCKEQIQLPKDVAANFGLTVGLFCQGIILSNGQQVDPGFRGTLFCLLFNTSNRVVTIKKNSHYATIEFNRMIDFADGYKGKYQGKKEIIDYIPPNVMQGAIHELKKEIEELKVESRSMQTVYIGVIGIIVAAISILLVIK